VVLAIAQIILTSGIDLRVHHIAGKKNIRADLLSRFLLEDLQREFPSVRVRLFTPHYCLSLFRASTVTLAQSAVRQCPVNVKLDSCVDGWLPCVMPMHIQLRPDAPSSVLWILGSDSPPIRMRHPYFRLASDSLADASDLGRRRMPTGFSRNDDLLSVSPKLIL
jgi:hypothetical protein